MSWRRFLVLLGGLSGESRWASHLAAEAERTKGQLTFDSQRAAQDFAASGYGMA